MTIPYAEIGITTNFSFLRGGSHPQDYVHQASELRLSAIGIADHNTLAGIVRAYSELENPEVRHKPKLLIGARIVFIDGTPDILVYPSRPRGLWPALPVAHPRQDAATTVEKGECHPEILRSPGFCARPASGPGLAASVRVRRPRPISWNG